MRPARARRSRDDRGAALVEAAVITPVFILLITGIFEFGLLFRNSLTTNNAAHQGARAASVSGDSPASDFLILRSIEHGLQAMDIDNLDFVVVFRASGPGDAVPSACLTSSQTWSAADPSAPACNRYTAAEFALEIDDSSGNDLGNFRCTSTAVDRYWCPTDRETSMATGVDYIGIHVQTTHHYVTGALAGTRTLSETRIMRLEPEAA